MADEASTSVVKVVDLGGLTKPAELLIEKISDAITGIARPWQIRRVAEAEADAEKIRALADIKIEELQRRAVARFIREEAKKQNNMEAITAKALPEIGEDAKPNEVEDDWIVNFFDKCRLISDEDMQKLWARVLAGEANSPGRFARNTVNLLVTLDKSDAQLFDKLSSFLCYTEDGFETMVYELEAAIYNGAGIDFDAIRHLEDLGLISYDHPCGFGTMVSQQETIVRYHDLVVEIDLKKPARDRHRLFIGLALLSRAGRELIPLCGRQQRAGFGEYLTQCWTKFGYGVSVIEREPE